MQLNYNNHMNDFIWEKLDIIDSTQIYASAMISNMIFQKPILITAKQQTNGFGQQGNKWVSPVGNLYATFCFIPKIECAYVVVALEIMQLVIKSLTKKNVILISNDLYYENKKFAGALATWQCDLLQKEILCLGIGVNLQHTVVPNRLTTFINCTANELILEWIKQAKNVLF